MKLCFLSGSGFSAGFVSTSKSRYLEINNLVSNNLNRNIRKYRNYPERTNSDIFLNDYLPVTSSVGDPDFLGLPDPDPLARGMDPNPAPAPDPSLFS